MDKQPNTIEEKVMSGITGGKVKLRSKYIFLAEKLGIGSAVVLSILFGVLFFSLLLYYLQATDNLIYLSFGREGFLAFLESFPYWLVIAFICIIFVTGVILRKTDLLYKKSYASVALGLLVFVTVGGVGLTYLGVGEYVERHGYGQGARAKIVQPFLQDCFKGREHGITGRVMFVEQDSFLLQTPEGLRRIVPPHLPLPRFLQRGNFVAAIGKQEGEVFHARQLRIIEDKHARMMRRAVHHKFGPLPEYR